MSIEKNREKARKRRHARLRQKIEGTPDRPRLCVTKTLKHTYAQIIDDFAAHTLVAASTLEDEVGNEKTATVEAAKAVGEAIGKRAVDEGIEQVVFDRGGWPYHGRVAAVAEGAREAGLDL